MLLLSRGAAPWRHGIETIRCFSVGRVHLNDGDRKSLCKRTAKSSTFVDELTVQVKGGQGGDGCIAFSRAKYVPYGPPSGASGGNGGDIYIESSRSVASLARVASSHVADAGQNGAGEWQVGRKGKDRIIRVPIGTVVTVQIDEEIPMDENEERAASYRTTLRRKYRNAFLRERRQSARSLPERPPEQEELDALQQRDQRDAVWRHYPGGSSAPVKNEEESMFDDAEDEDDFAEEEREAHLNAESDIARMIDGFRESERRYAFSLLSEDIITKREKSARNEAWLIQEETESEQWSVDLIEETKEPLLLVSGGSGGLGNAVFLSSSNKSPKLATKGIAGQSATVHLEWKFKGDVGLIGLPNAGKSTFLKSVSETGQDVRVGSYAFTTISPNVGVVRLSEQGLLGVSGDAVIEESSTRRLIGTGEEEVQSSSRRSITSPEVMRFTLQDLPGLVEGASNNRGLGHSFLKHVERCLALYYVVDVREQPWEDLRLVYDELESYQEGLSRKVRGVIANKCDLLDESQKEKLQHLREKVRELHGDQVRVYNVSAKHRQGVERVARAMAQAVEEEHNIKQEHTA